LSLVLLSEVFGTAISLPEKFPVPMRSPGIASHNYSRLHLLEATSSSAKHKLCCRMEAEQGKEFWRRLFGGKISCDGGDTPGAD
jgi:hypothetical protein